ncbi:hypothetical protein [Jannaschia formosa]|uniref:hypothetical protein n=1 Tax=Jannaschia formosa TaxID=2259592 RepID=UPI000E1B6FA4|nr:hypothetical protein [Jannaschia formosa]TFL17780.1 hypothetical protein DR046_12830 [Jannaschia formosa]
MIRATRRLSACLLVAAGMLGGPVFAQGAGPAEIPAETYRGDQYVDSTGCVFIRAAIGGATRWLPRVGRDRLPVCGARPSVAALTASPAGLSHAAELRPAATERPETHPVAEMPSACGTSALSARYVPGCASDGTVTLTSASNPSAIPGSGPATSAVTRPRRVGEQTVVRLVPPPDAVRIGSTLPSPNRSVGAGGTAEPAARGCAPDCDVPHTALATPLPVAVIERPRAVVVPAARTTFDVGTPPRGYRPAFEDGRLNPLRGPRTLQGDYQTRAIWTNETPRRLRGVIYTSR